MSNQKTKNSQINMLDYKSPRYDSDEEGSEYESNENNSGFNSSEDSDGSIERGMLSDNSSSSLSEEEYEEITEKGNELLKEKLQVIVNKPKPAKETNKEKFKRLQYELIYHYITNLLGSSELSQFDHELMEQVIENLLPEVLGTK